MVKSTQTLLFITAAGLILTGCASRPPKKGSDQRGYNFRDTRWGMTPAQVEETESGDLLSKSSGPDKLTYTDRLMEKIPVEIAYHFKGGKLVRGSYLLRDDLSPAEYSMFFYILAKKYGDPVNSGRTEDMAEATWEAGPTEIDILARGENFTDFRPGKGKANAGVTVDSITINYYDRSWFKKSAERIAKEEKEDKETSQTYHRYLGSWVELYPDYYVYDDAF